MTTACLLMVPVLGLAAAPQEPRKELMVRKISIADGTSSLDAVAQAFDRENIPSHPIACSWEMFPYRPDVKFRIAYDNTSVYLQYQVHENYLLAKCDLNDDTCWPSNDSCVEFFVSPTSDNHYINFEFSCIGYCLIQTGERDPENPQPPMERTRLPLEATKQVKRESTLGNQTFEHREGDFSWTLTVAIPLSLITEQDGAALRGKTWKANFYKCGDELKEKAYLTWSPVNMPFPTFHQPQEFGTIAFE